MNYQENGSEYGKSQFYDLYKEIQNEIKDKVITKLLLQVQNMYSELSNLKLENTSLKNHLSYILKRILLHKNEYNFINNKKKLHNSSVNIKKSLLNNSSIIKDSYLKTSQNTFKPLRSVENYRCVTEEDYFNPLSRKKNNKNNKNMNDGEYIYDQHNSTLIDHKINGYLNTLYRNNFVTGNSGISNNYNLNKKKTIIEELFPNHNNTSGRINYKTINQEESYLGKKISHSKNLTNISRRGNSIIKNDRNKKSMKITKPNNSSIINKKRPIRIKNYREELIKGVYFDTSKLFDDLDYEFKFDFDDNYASRNYENKNKKKTHHNHRNPKNNYGEKIKAKKDLLYMKRSPFLVNKY